MVDAVMMMMVCCAVTEHKQQNFEFDVLVQKVTQAHWHHFVRSSLYLVGAIGAYTSSSPFCSLTTVMRMVVVTLRPARDCSCSKHQMVPGST